MGYCVLNKYLVVKIFKIVNIYVDVGYFLCLFIGDINIGLCFCGFFILFYYSLVGNFFFFRIILFYFILCN